MTRIFTTIAFLTIAGQLPAAEIALRSDAQPAGAVITLGDVAEVYAATAEDARRLATIELFAAPPSGRARTVKLREIQDLLALSGESLVDHRFSGAPEVRIGSAEAATTAPKLTPKVAKHTRSQLTARIERAIAQHLQQAVDDRVAWQVTLEISPEQIATLAGKSAEIVAVGGKEPWTGDQSFTLQARGAGGSARLNVNAHVRLPDMVVVAKRPFRRGEVVRAVDVELQAPATSNAIALATRIEDVVGRETTRSVATGQPLEESWLRQPIMVRRGEIVTVYARAANLLVRTQARATEDGGRDEVVVVERLDNRQRYSARVVGVQELEVLVGGVKVGSTR